MIAGLTVADLGRPSEKGLARIYDAALVVSAAIVIALCTQIAIGYPVPITGQTFAVLMAATLLGARRGVLCVLTYLTAGVAGLPVFSYGKAGLAAMLGPTGGYLLGFVAAAYVVGRLAERGWDRQVVTTVLAMVLGNLAIYACGLIWLSFFAGTLGGRGVLAVGLYPFLLGDLLKIALAALLLPSGWRVLRRFGVAKSAETV